MTDITPSPADEPQDGVSGDERSELFNLEEEEKPPREERGVSMRRRPKEDAGASGPTPDQTRRISRILNSHSILRRQIQALQDAFEREHAFMQERFERTMAEKDRIDSMLEELSRIESGEEDISPALRERIEKLKAARTEIAGEKEKLIQEMDALEQEQSNLQAQLDALSDRIHQALSNQGEQPSSKLDEQLNQQQEQVQLLENRVQYLLAELEKAQTAQSTVDERYMALHQEHMETVRELEDLRSQKLTSLTDDEREMLQGRVNYLITEMESITVERDRMDQLYAEQHMENARLRKAFDDLQEEFQSFHTAQQGEENRDLEQELREAKEWGQILETERNRLLHSVEDLTAQLAEMESHQIQSSLEADRLRTEVKGLRTDITEREDKADEREQTRVRHLLEELDDARDAYDAVEKALDDAQRSLSNRDEQLEDLRAQLAEATINKYSEVEEDAPETAELLRQRDLLQARLEAAETDRASLSERLKILESEFTRTRNQLKAAERAQRELLAIRNQLEREGDISQERFMETQRRLREVTAELDTRVKEVGQETQRRTRDQSQLREMEKQVHEIQDLYNAAQVELREVQAQCRVLQREQEAQDSEGPDTLRRAHESSEKKVVLLESTIEQMAAERDRAMHALRRSEGQLADVHADLEKVNKERDGAWAKVREVRVEREELIDEASELRRELNKSSSRLEYLEHRENELSRDVEFFEEERKRIHEESNVIAAGLRSERDHYRQEAEHGEALIKDLVKAKQMLEAALEEAEKKQQNLESHVEASRLDADVELQQELKQLRKVESKLQGKIEKAKASRKEWQAERRTLYAEKKKLAAQIERLSQEVIQLSADPEAAGGSLGMLRREVDELRALFELLRDERSNLKAEFRAILDQNQKLLDELDALRRHEEGRGPDGTELGPGLRLIDEG